MFLKILYLCEIICDYKGGRVADIVGVLVCRGQGRAAASQTLSPPQHSLPPGHILHSPQDLNVSISLMLLNNSSEEVWFIFHHFRGIRQP